jgi:hypothetical protein
LDHVPDAGLCEAEGEDLGHDLEDVEEEECQRKGSNPSPWDQEAAGMRGGRFLRKRFPSCR